MNRSTILSATLLFVLSFAAVVVVRLPTTSSSTAAQRINPAQSWNSSVDWLPSRESDYGDLVTQAEAAQRLPFPLPAVAYVPSNASLKSIYVSPKSTPLAQRYVIMVFTNGMLLEANPTITKIGWDAFVGLPGTTFKTVAVRGNPALAADPGDQVLSGGAIWHHQGSLAWQVGDVVFTIYGEYQVAELVKVAESMY